MFSGKDGQCLSNYLDKKKSTPISMSFANFSE